MSTTTQKVPPSSWCDTCSGRRPSIPDYTNEDAGSGAMESGHSTDVGDYVSVEVINTYHPERGVTPGAVQVAVYLRELGETVSPGNARDIAAQLLRAADLAEQAAAL